MRMCMCGCIGMYYVCVGVVVVKSLGKAEEKLNRFINGNGGSGGYDGERLLCGYTTNRTHVLLEKQKEPTNESFTFFFFHYSFIILLLISSFINGYEKRSGFEKSQEITFFLKRREGAGRDEESIKVCSVSFIAECWFFVYRP